MLILIKVLGLLFIVSVSTYIGVLISRKYLMRVKELQDFITALEIFETRITYTGDTIPECFSFIASNLKTKVKNVFKNSCEKLKDCNNLLIGDCFRNSLEEEKILLSLEKDDIEILNGLSISLGQTDLENQVKNIKLIIQNLTIELEIAKINKDKNYKLSRNLGMLVGIMVAIILI